MHTPGEISRRVLIVRFVYLETNSLHNNSMHELGAIEAFLKDWRQQEEAKETLRENFSFQKRGDLVLEFAWKLRVKPSLHICEISK